MRRMLITMFLVATNVVMMTRRDLLLMKDEVFVMERTNFASAANATNC